jgi:hypothetical protein
MKKLFACITVVLLLSAAAVFAGEGGGCGAPPCGAESGSDLQAQGGRSDPGSRNEGGPASGTGYTPEGSRPAEAGSLYRQEAPKNSVGSRWQVEMGGFIEMDAGRRQ